MYSKFLKSRKDACKKLIELLGKKYEYVSILGSHVTGKNVAGDLRSTVLGDSRSVEAGFVIKVYNENHYSEYSCNDINLGQINELVEDIIKETTLAHSLVINSVKSKILQEDTICEVFNRSKEGKDFSDSELVERINTLKLLLKNENDLVINAQGSYASMGVSKCFYSKNKDLEQNYYYANISMAVVVRRENTIKVAYTGVDGINDEQLFDQIFCKAKQLVKTAFSLLDAKTVKPGMYDVITDPSITGLIAHEAFGHGVEMDMFVKNRALAKDYIGKYVASSLVSMHDGASATNNVASYFFDDDGILAHDTLIIKEGILLTGISDCLSALQLGTQPTGNGRRQSFKRKAYSRMTNTFFSKGTDKLDEMIKSIKQGYILYQTSNGMEDPKNWGIQCVAQYGREIVDGKLTDNYVAPVVMSGYVPDLLKSISMISDEFEVSGSGSCGKGYKEWVRVSDGGPHLKCKVKLG